MEDSKKKDTKVILPDGQWFDTTECKMYKGSWFGVGILSSDWMLHTEKGAWVKCKRNDLDKGQFYDLKLISNEEAAGWFLQHNYPMSAKGYHIPESLHEIINQKKL